jgi:SAM-dependent methyltransferase
VPEPAAQEALGARFAVQPGESPGRDEPVSLEATLRAIKEPLNNPPEPTYWARLRPEERPAKGYPVEVEVGCADLLDFFEDYDYRRCKCPERLDYRRADHIVGYQQRAFVLTWALDSLRAGYVGIELGGQAFTPGCIDVDRYAGEGTGRSDGQNPHIQADACDLSLLRSGKWGNVISSHVLEHVDDPYRAVAEALRLMAPGRYFAMIVPDAAMGPWNYPDERHVTAFTSEGHLVPYEAEQVGHPQRVLRLRDFAAEVCARFPCRLIEMDTLNNHFSMNLVLQKI